MRDDVEAPAARVAVRHGKWRPNTHARVRDGSIVYGPQAAVPPGDVHSFWIAGIDRKDRGAVCRREFARRVAGRPTVRWSANDERHGGVIRRPSRAAVE